MKTFIEIGSCDFETNLPLIESGRWHGWMVEPSPPYFNKLEKIAENIPHRDKLILEKSAISDYDGMINFAVAKDHSQEARMDEEWRRGISSVVADNHRGERLFDLADNHKFVDEFIEVPCMTLNSLVAKTKYEHINYLKIDTEGHEMNILDAYDWAIKPDFIKCEHSHIDDTYVVRLLKSQGYMVYTEKTDIYAIL